MGKKHKQHGTATLEPRALQPRVDKAMQEGRFQQALELGKQLYKQEPTPLNRELLLKIYLGRAQQLRKQGNPRDARTTLDNALQLGGGDSAYQEQLAEELATCGDIRRALAILGGLPDSPAQTRVLALAADWAVQQGPAARSQLPESFGSQLELILKASEQLGKGEDEPAKETLQGIGLQSPFLEWKLLLRGLQAYYQNDDARANENWQRLNPERMPARLAAPLRLQTDEAFRRAQDLQTQATLQKQADALQGTGLVHPLRVLQKVLANTEQLPSAFRLAEGLIQALQKEAPHLVPRLAACFYWSIVENGEPEDLLRYARVFGEPREDTGLFRLRALLFEHQHDLDLAHKEWQQFEDSVSKNPAAWPGEYANRVRALIWCRMGQNAASLPDLDKLEDLPPFLRDHPERPKPLVPSAETCLERSIELGPDQLEAYEALLGMHLKDDDKEKAERIARRLLEHFPEHVQTLQVLANLRTHKGDPAEALTLLQRALKANPLDRRLRSSVSTAHLFKARNHAEKGQFDEARAEYQNALSYSDTGHQSGVYCKWSACEFKAGNLTRAEELLQQALGETANQLVVCYSMLIESSRLDLPKKLRNRFNKQFNEGLAERPTGEAAAALAEGASQHRVAGVTYHGQKTHDKKVLAYLEKALKSEFTEEQMDTTCEALLSLESFKLLHKFIALARRRFPKNPRFPFLEAERYLAEGPARSRIWNVQKLLKEARTLALAMPVDSKQKDLLAAIESCQRRVGVHDFLGGAFDPGSIQEMFAQAFGGMMGEFVDDDDDDFDDEDDW